MSSPSDAPGSPSTDPNQRPRVAVIAEFYPRADDHVLGVWAHRQAVAARDAGAAVEVFVLHRVVPPLAALRRGPVAALQGLRRLLAQPRRERRDGVTVHYVKYVSPPRRRGYARWGWWAAPALRRALRAAGPVDVIHAHNAVPAGDAALRARPDAATPLVVSIHGSDVLWTTERVPGGRNAVERVLEQSALVLANSAGIEQLARTHGARQTRVVHLGTELPQPPPEREAAPTLITVGHLVARKRHADVIAALARLRPHHPELRYQIVGDGPERATLERLAIDLGAADRVTFLGMLAPAAALERAWRAWLFVMPSTEEAFGVAYAEAMAAGVPAIGAADEPGPRELVAAGGGIELVPAGDIDALAATVDALLRDDHRRRRLGELARLTVEREFTWERCGARTLDAYRDVLSGTAT